MNGSTMMSSLFRTLIIVYAVLMLVSGLVPFVYMNTEDPNLWQLLQWDGYSATFTLDAAIYWAWAAVDFGVLAGLYFYWRPARTAFVVLLVLSVAMAAFDGVRVTHQLDNVVGTLMYPLYGALISMSYLTSVANRFEVTQRAIAKNG
jgi:hypothetical protein